jgi:16S rRNA (adenine1518-N6/adenine1519-N6)-dimethyltransferase
MGFQDYRVKTKKSLGQNFFVNEHLGEKIANVVSEEKSLNLTEIGGGRGFFTRKLQKSYSNLFCIEKDNVLARNLSIELPDITVFNQDFLEFDLDRLPEETVFFGSLPYNISKPIIKKIITSNRFNKPCFFIIQKEVADKYVALEPDNNLLSLTTRLYATPKKLFNINSGAFRPKPRVESAFIRFDPLLKKDIPNGFESFLQKCFRSPRKTIKNNLGVKSDNPLLEKRPAQLSLNEFLILYSENLL